MQKFSGDSGPQSGRKISSGFVRLGRVVILGPLLFLLILPTAPAQTPHRRPDVETLAVTPSQPPPNIRAIEEKIVPGPPARPRRSPTPVPTPIAIATPVQVTPPPEPTHFRVTPPPRLTPVQVTPTPTPKRKPVQVTPTPTPIIIGTTEATSRWLYVLLGGGLFVVVVLAYLLKGKQVAIPPSPTFYPHWDRRAPLTRRPESVSINYELHFDPNVSSGQHEIDTLGTDLVTSIRRNND